jgi:hypothetical protein
MSAVEKRWDVVIFEFATRKVSSVIGLDLPESGAFHTVDKRINSGCDMVNEHHGVIGVPSGRFKKGDILPQGVETYYE